MKLNFYSIRLRRAEKDKNSLDEYICSFDLQSIMSHEINIPFIKTIFHSRLFKIRPVFYVILFLISALLIIPSLPIYCNIYNVKYPDIIYFTNFFPFIILLAIILTILTNIGDVKYSLMHSEVLNKRGDANYYFCWYKKKYNFIIEHSISKNSDSMTVRCEEKYIQRYVDYLEHPKIVFSSTSESKSSYMVKEKMPTRDQRSENTKGGTDNDGDGIFNIGFLIGAIGIPLLFFKIFSNVHVEKWVYVIMVMAGGFIGGAIWNSFKIYK